MPDNDELAAAGRFMAALRGDRYLAGTLVEVCALWPQDMSSLWVRGFTVIADDGGRLITVSGPDNVERLAQRDAVRLESSEA